jgi:outer membrane protein assembly factor BamB
VRIEINNNKLISKADDGTILKEYKSISKIEEVKEIDTNCIIVREKIYNSDRQKSNIYCLDNDFKKVWFADLPVENDDFPNPIQWNKEINENGIEWNDYLVENSKTFTTSSQKGITVSIEYETGKILKSIFTK